MLLAMRGLRHVRWSGGPGVLAAAVAVAVFTSTAYAQAPSIGSLSPQAAAPGSTVDVTIGGGALAGATSLWKSFPGEVLLAPDVEGNGTNDGQVVFRVTVPPETPPGIYAMRLATNRGISNLRLFVVDDMPSVAQVRPNNAPEQAQELQLPAAVDGYVDNLSHDYYRINVAAGQRLSVEVLGRRLGSPIDPMVRILTPEGREVAYNDDLPHLGTDCALSHTFPEAGTYLIEVRDIRFRGGGEYRYRLRVGTFPLLTVPYPVGSQRGQQVPLSFAGPAAEGAVPVTVTVPADPDLEMIWVGARGPSHNASGFARLAVSDLPNALETEPNNEAAQATPVALPSAINGRLEAPGEQDHFKFHVASGQRFILQATTRELGSPADLYLRLLDPTGNQIAEGEENGQLDARIDFTGLAEGEYTLVVRDLHRRGGPEFAYRIEAEPYQPGFTLSATADTVNVPQGGAAMIAVNAVRLDYGGPITVQVEGLPQGLTSSSSIIGPGQTTTFVTVSATGDMAAGPALAVRVVGTAQINGQPYRAEADVTEPVRVALANFRWPPLNVTRVVAMGVGQPQFFTLQCDPPVAQIGRNVPFTVTVRATRQEGFNGPINLSVDNLPPNVAVNAQPIPEGQTEVQLTFTTNNDTPMGQFTVLVKGQANHNGADMTLPAPALNMNIAQPFAVSVELGEGRLARGGTLRARIAAERHGYAGPITVELRNLPAGVSGPPEIVLAQGILAVEIELRAAPDAAVGTIDNLSVVGRGMVGETPIEQAAPNARLEVAE